MKEKTTSRKLYDTLVETFFDKTTAARATLSRREAFDPETRRAFKQAGMRAFGVWVKKELNVVTPPEIEEWMRLPQTQIRKLGSTSPTLLQFYTFRSAYMDQESAMNASFFLRHGGKALTELRKAKKAAKKVA